ncbi:MAG: Y-family DNA polymerase [Candidatus Cloacimonetes bacterium]|nr:Y-family DNA polymerase [Candidatus Cloacimonadota bacterium]
MKKECFALVDCNNFYVSCERVFRPDLVGKPVGVLSNNDGIIVSASQELKALNMGRGTAPFKVIDQIRKHNVHLFSSNYALYGDISARVMKTLANFAYEVEIYSIDEAFLSLKGMEHLDLTKYGAEIKKTVEKWVGIPVSVGIGPTKTLSKLANVIAKKYNKFNGVFDLTDHPKMDKVLSAVPVEKIWGVGFKYAKMLRKHGINNAYQLSKAPHKWVQKKMTIVGLRMVKELNGISCIDIELDIDPRKQIVSSKSFGVPVTELQDLKEAATVYCSRAVEKLRDQNLVASLIMVYLTTNRFRQNEPQYANYESFQIPVPSAFTPDFLKPMTVLLKRLYRPGYKYKKVGIMISEIMSERQAPLDFFEPCYLDDRRKIIMNCLDLINKKYNSNTLVYAGVGKEQKWKMRRDNLSPRYTTNWDELPVIKD